jgi:hypothetical protein
LQHSRLPLHLFEGRQTDLVSDLAALLEPVLEIGDGARCRAVEAFL